VVLVLPEIAEEFRNVTVLMQDAENINVVGAF
jgi:hypothetical protein